MAVTEPLLVLQVAETDVAVTVGAFELLTVVFTVLVHPFASLIVTV